MNLQDKWNSRKLAVALIGLLVASLLVVGGYIDSVAWSTAFAISVGGFMGSQAWEDVKRVTVSADRSAAAGSGAGGSN